MTRLLPSKRLVPMLAAALCVAVAGALYWFQPWRLVTDTTVRDSLTVVASPSPSPSASVAPGTQAGPAVLAEGRFVSHEHDTQGTARIVRRADGGHQLELVGLTTSDGPDLRVWLTDQPVPADDGGWQVFDDGRYVELGRLKGNRGDQVYPIDAGIDPRDFRSVTIWCKRFSVSFGAAPLTT